MTHDSLPTHCAPGSTDLLIEAAAQQPKTVLLVDDDAKLLRGLKRTLAEEDYEVLTAISASEAQAIVSSQHVDLILCDNLMVGTLGTEFLAKIREQYPEMVLMMLSGYMPEAAAIKITQSIGVSRILNKPCSATEVAAAIRDALNEHDD